MNVSTTNPVQKMNSFKEWDKEKDTSDDALEKFGVNYNCSCVS